MITKAYILFHDSCIDGAASCAVTESYIKTVTDDWEVVRIPVQYGKPLSTYLTEEQQKSNDSWFFIVDFSFPREELEQLCPGHVTVIDHHKTAEKALEGLDYATFDMDECGATLCWKTFFQDLPMPPVLFLVKDRDLWLWQYKKMTEPFSEAIRLSLFDWDLWQELLDVKVLLESDTVRKLLAAGEVLIEQKSRAVKSAVKNARRCTFKGYKAAVINQTSYGSEIGEAFYSNPDWDIDIAIVFFVTETGDVVLSFRSKQGSGPDVGELARQLGGGGHKHASGARVSLDFLKTEIFSK